MYIYMPDQLSMPPAHIAALIEGHRHSFTICAMTIWVLWSQGRPWRILDKPGDNTDNHHHGGDQHFPFYRHDGPSTPSTPYGRRGDLPPPGQRGKPWLQRKRGMKQVSHPLLSCELSTDKSVQVNARRLTFEFLINGGSFGDDWAPPQPVIVASASTSPVCYELLCQ